MAAPPGNKYALGCETSGRPPMYNDHNILHQKILDYFGKTESPYTITGLCLYCGFESRQSFYDYEVKDEFAYIIKRARLTIENIYESKLQSNNPSGSIFALKNMDWTDKTDITSGGNPITPIIRFVNDRDNG